MFLINQQYCYFYNYLVPYQIWSENNIKLNFNYKIDFPLKINFNVLYNKNYINIQIKNYQYASIYENGIELNNKLDNAFIELKHGNDYYIEYKINNNGLIYLNFYDHEINEVTFQGINIDIMNSGKYYFFAKKGFGKENGGIIIEKAIFPNNILFKKIDNIENIYNIDYKNLLDSTFDCIISNTILEYPILEKDSYFIFSMTAYVDFKLKLFDKNPKDNNENEGNKEKKRKDYNNGGHTKNKAYLAFSIIFGIVFVF